MRVGVIGSGFGARVVAPVFASTDGCEVVDVVSARDARAVRDLCERTDLDLVSVHTPPMLHRSTVQMALDAGTAVLCDKPFGRSGIEATVMAGHARERGVVALVNFEFRYEPARRMVKDLIERGEIGAVERVAWSHVSSATRVPLRPAGWLFDRAAGGGWLGAWGAHAIDTVRWWCGELTVLAADLRTEIPTRPDADGEPVACDAEDALLATLATTSGARVVLDSTSTAAASLAPRVVVVGSEATVEVVADHRVVVRRLDGSRTEWVSPEIGEADPHLGAMRSWAEVVRDSVVAGTALADAATFVDGRVVATLMDEIRVRAGTLPAE